YEKLFTGHDGRRRVNTFLRQTIGGNVLPRLRKVAARYKLAADAIDLPFGKSLERLPSLDRPELKKLAGQISGWISQSLYDFTERFDSGTDDAKELHRRTMESYRYLCAC
ncbi:replication endonuclease, partial [Salmonella sp. KL24021]